MCCKSKYRANIIHYFILFSFFIFFYHSSCRKLRISLKFFKCGTQDFTDPGLLKIRRTLTGLSLWFFLHKCFCNIDPPPRSAEASLCCGEAGKKGKESARGTMGREKSPESRLYPLPIVPHALSFFFFFFSIIAIFIGRLCGGERDLGVAWQTLLTGVTLRLQRRPSKPICKPPIE